LIERAGRAAPDAAIDGVLVQKMQAVGRELAIGVVQDPDFGPMMMVGMGGIHIEVMRDVAIEPLPVRRPDAERMLRSLRAWPLLEGVRGEAAADIEAVMALMESLSMMVEGAAGAVREIYLNPVFVYPRGKGAVIIDALVVGAKNAGAGH
jgi:acyl-CoA synthetase (NDP forming)